MHIYIDDSSSPMKEFQLPADFRPELSRTNPFLSDEGSQSVPLTLPASDHNLKIIGYSYRTTSAKRPIYKFPVFMADGVIWMRGTLRIEQIHKKEGINCTFYTNEGQLYEKIKDYQLKDLNWPKYTGEGSDITAKARYWMNKFLEIMGNTNNTNSDYCVFSATTDYVFVTNYERQYDDTLIINQYSQPNDTILFEARNERKYKDGYGENATEYTVPVGYGVTPFLRLGYILRHIFEYFGYKLSVNIFDEEISFKQICLLNNVADAIVSGVLDYGQLIPQTLSVEDLIKNVRKKFSVEFIEINGTIFVKTWNQILSMSADLDLSKYIRNDITWITQDKESIQIEYESTYSFDSEALNVPLKHASIAGTESVDLSTDDKIPFNQIALLYYYPHLGSVHYLSAPYIGQITHKNSELVLTGSTEAEKEDTNNMDLMFCFSIPSVQLVTGLRLQYYAGTIWSYDNNNETWGTLSLVANEVVGDVNPTTKGSDNIYNKLYLSRDKMLQNANQQIIYEASIPSYTIANMDISNPKIIKGQIILIERIDYVLDKPELSQITARTLHLYPEE